jgi:hypothetical protein
MAHYNQQLIPKYNFEYDSFSDITGDFSITVINLTASVLHKNDARTDPKREVFRSGPYIFDGRNSLRIGFPSTAVVGDFALRYPLSPSKAVMVQPGDKLSCGIAARCSVNGNALRARIIGMLGSTDTLFLEPMGNTASVATNYQHLGGGFMWNSSTRDIELIMHDVWQVFGFELNIPPGIDRIAIRVQNGTAGAQTIDLGAFMLREQDRVKVA